MGLSVLVGGKLIGLLFVLLAIFVPRFRVLGWWLTVVVVALVLATSVGTGIYLAGHFGELRATSAMMTWQSVGQVGFCALGSVLALLGLVARGTRRAVEARTVAVAPGAFEESK